MAKNKNRATSRQSKSDYGWWEELMSAQRTLQRKFPDFVLVGGSASAIHCKHRFSRDGDHVVTDLRAKFEEILCEVEKQAGWKTSKIKPPVMILGSFKGVETGIRQLIRKKPLETTVVSGVRIPTIEEMLRVKAYLIVKRNATRDFLDMVALFDRTEKDFGRDIAIGALKSLDEFYPQGSGETISRQLCKQLAEPKPYDLSGDRSLKKYRGLIRPYDQWDYIEKRCSEISVFFLRAITLKEDLYPGGSRR